VIRVKDFTDAEPKSGEGRRTEGADDEDPTETTATADGEAVSSRAGGETERPRARARPRARESEREETESRRVAWVGSGADAMRCRSPYQAGPCLSFSGGPGRAARRAHPAAQARPGKMVRAGPGTKPSEPGRAWAGPKKRVSCRATVLWATCPSITTTYKVQYNEL
jgi:hypothetical protein